jgi:D-alanine transaminase
LAGLDIPIQETAVPASAVLVADEIFLTSSLREIAPVTVVDGRPVGAGTVGAFTVRVRAAFNQLVAAEVADGLAGPT